MRESARIGCLRVDLQGERIGAVNVSPDVWCRPIAPSRQRLRLAGSEESGGGKLGTRWEGIYACERWRSTSPQLFIQEMTGSQAIYRSSPASVRNRSIDPLK